MFWERTNLVKVKIDKTQKDTLCTLCKKADESIDHVVSGCSKLSQNEYKRRHDNLAKIVQKLQKLGDRRPDRIWL